MSCWQKMCFEEAKTVAIRNGMVRVVQAIKVWEEWNTLCVDPTSVQVSLSVFAPNLGTWNSVIKFYGKKLTHTTPEDDGFNGRARQEWGIEVIFLLNPEWKQVVILAYFRQTMKRLPCNPLSPIQRATELPTSFHSNNTLRRTVLSRIWH
jgi:hypothetical protein